MGTKALADKVSRLEGLFRTSADLGRPMLTLLRDNPALPMLAAGMAPDPWQQKLLHSRAERILLLCSRQAGKSTAAAALALQTALLAPQAVVLLFSPSLRQSGELFRKVKDLFSALRRPMAVTGDSALHLELANGARIISLPGQEGTIRGFSKVSLLIIDEAARVPDELYRSVRPMLAVSQGRIIALSTPFGKRGWFYEEWRGNGCWERYRVPASEVPRIRQEFLERERQALGDAWFRQEYCCDFTQMAGLVYPEFADCVVDPCSLPPIERSIAGVDFGYHHPSAAVFGLQDKDDVLWIVDEVYGSRMTDEELIRRVKPLAEDHQTELLWCDSSAPQSIEKMRRADLRARAAIKTVNPGIRAVAARIRTGRLKVFRTCANLVAEAELYRYPEEDDIAALRKDQPVKENDHALDALRYLIAGLDRVRGIDDWQQETPEPEADALPPSRQIDQPEPNRPDWMRDAGWEPRA